MSSAIDPTRPQDGMPASKADLRANLAAAKAELEHGGFAEGVSPANYGPPASSRVADHLNAIDQALAVAESGDAGLTGYTAPGQGAITRSVGDRLSDVISVKDFGAVGDGETDDTAAFTAASAAVFDMAHPTAGPTIRTEQVLFGHQGRITGAMLLIPPGLYRLKNWTLDKAITVIGCGRASRLAPTNDATSTDYVMRVTLGPHAYRNRNNHHPGVHFTNFMIDGLARTIDCGGLLLDRLDRSHLQHIIIEEIQGTGLRLLQSCRESTFLNLRMMYCGDADRAQVDMYDAGAKTDAHNNLHFIGCGFLNPIGDNIRIGGDPANGSTVRSIFFTDCMMHGATNIYRSDRPTRHFWITRGTHIHIANCRIHGWGETEPAIYMSHEAGEDPSTGIRAVDVLTTNCNFSRGRDADHVVALNATTPHVRIDARSTWYDTGNSYETVTDAVVDRRLGTHRRYSYVDNPG